MFRNALPIDIRRRTKKRLGSRARLITDGLLVLPVVALLGFATYAAWTVSAALGGVEMEGHGVVALLLGSFVTLALAGVLIWLMVHHRDSDGDR